MLSAEQLNPTSRTLRQFAGAWFVVFLAAGLRQFVHGHKMAGVAFALIAAIGIAGMLKPPLLKHLFIGATILAFPFGWIVTQLVLAIMFYLIFTPIALISRWRRRNPLQLRRQADRSSYWVPRGGPPPPEKYLKQF